MKNKRNKILSFMLALLLMCVYSSTVLAEYTITIPSTLRVQNPGWNELPGGISVTGDNFEGGKSLIIAASSNNDFKFVNTSDNNQTVSYNFCASSSDTTPVTTWIFDTPTTRRVGINVEDYSERPEEAEGTYTERVTFEAELAKVVDLSKLTANYTAQNGDVLMNKLAQDIKITVAANANITLWNATISRVGGGGDWAGITPNGHATITLKGENIVSAFNNSWSGIYIPVNYMLTINGDGSLTAIGIYGAGIGCGRGSDRSCGHITINSGTIIARADSIAAGIGCGDPIEGTNKCGNITITGGTITASTGAYYTVSSIGKGNNGKCGTIKIGTQTVSGTLPNPYTVTL